MGKLFYIMGKSASGKDHIYERLLESSCVQLERVVLYTTRPIREGEEEGKQYYFVTEPELEKLREEGRLIEERAYNTIHGIWYYFTADDGRVRLKEKNYIGIGTLESYEKIRNYYGEENVCPIYIEVEDGERLLRAIHREQNQKLPKYEEMCRRFLADCQDFTEEKIKKLNIQKRFENKDFEICIEEIEAYILQNQ